ncbi:MAG: hypothetical protein ACP5LA_02395 [Thermoplasmata archaeon]|nr:hypothetical protein [Thermoplasmata archaeon]
MSDLNEDLKKIREAEEMVTNMIKKENDLAQARIDEARKKADEIIKNAEEELNKIKNDLEREYNEKTEKEIEKLKKEWEEKMNNLKKIKIEKDFILEIIKNLLEEK